MSKLVATYNSALGIHDLREVGDILPRKSYSLAQLYLSDLIRYVIWDLGKNPVFVIGYHTGQITVCYAHRLLWIDGKIQRETLSGNYTCIAQDISAEEINSEILNKIKDTDVLICVPIFGGINDFNINYSSIVQECSKVYYTKSTTSANSDNIVYNKEYVASLKNTVRSSYTSNCVIQELLDYVEYLENKFL